MSNYAEQLQETLVGRKKISILEVNRYLDNLFDLSNKAVTEFQQADKSDELDAAEERIGELEEDVVELKEKVTPPNLLDYQLKTLFDEIISSPFINQLKFLELLEQVSKLQIKL